MATVLNLKGRPLAAKACGQCSGSSNDGKIRMDRKTSEKSK